MESVLLINIYFGVWPIWFDTHLKSIENNQTINWLIATDCPTHEAQGILNPVFTYTIKYKKSDVS